MKTAKQKKAQQAFKKMVAKAKSIYHKGKAKTWASAMKKAAK